MKINKNNDCDFTKINECLGWVLLTLIVFLPLLGLLFLLFKQWLLLIGLGITYSIIVGLIRYKLPFNVVSSYRENRNKVIKAMGFDDESISGRFPSPPQNSYLTSIYWVKQNKIKNEGKRALLKDINTVANGIRHNFLFIVTIVIFVVAFFYFKNLITNINGEKEVSIIVGLIAFTGALLAFLGVAIQSRYRLNVEVLSKNRQDWINNLREAVSKYIPLVEEFAISGLTPGKSYQDHVKLHEKRKEIASVRNYIRLLLSASQQSDMSESKKDAERVMELSKVLEESVYGGCAQNHSLDGWINAVNGMLDFPEVCEVWNIEGGEELAENFEQLSVRDQIILMLLVVGSLSNALNLTVEKILKDEWRRVKRGA